MITINLTPWSRLTRSGIPDFVVARRPILAGGVLLQPGETVTTSAFPSRTRMRQMYEQRRIEPLHAPKGTVQAARQPVSKTQARIDSAVKSVIPVTSVAVDVMEEQPRMGGYRPSRSNANVKNRR